MPRPIVQFLAGYSGGSKGDCCGLIVYLEDLVEVLTASECRDLSARLIRIAEWGESWGGESKAIVLSPPNDLIDRAN